MLVWRRLVLTGGAHRQAGDGKDLDQGVDAAVALVEGEEEDAGDVEREQAEDDAVPGKPGVVGKRPTSR